MVASGFEKIEKENIEGLKFPVQDVLNSQAEIQKRQKDLERALSLGNMEQIKIKIFFEDTISPKYVETTVWGVTDERVILKQGVVIPINRIHFLEL